MRGWIPRSGRRWPVIRSLSTPAWLQLTRRRIRSMIPIAGVTSMALRNVGRGRVRCCACCVLSRCVSRSHLNVMRVTNLSRGQLYIIRKFCATWANVQNRGGRSSETNFGPWWSLPNLVGCGADDYLPWGWFSDTWGCDYRPEYAEETRAPARPTCRLSGSPARLRRTMAFGDRVFQQDL